MLPTPQVLLPEAWVDERGSIDTRTATGLFAYRHTQAFGLLDLPDFGGGNLDTKQRQDALAEAVAFHKPLAALSLFLGVVALEDYVRDLVARMAENADLSLMFPQLVDVRAHQRRRTPDQSFRRLDTDPAGVIDPEDINAVFQRAIGVNPIAPIDYWHLRDLALLRHTIAHHAAVIRHVDLPRFRYFQVSAGRVINPPPAFVKSELGYLYQIGCSVEAAVRAVVFRKAIAFIGIGWSAGPDPRIVDLIKFFSYFGHIESTTVPLGYSDSESPLRKLQERESERVQEALLARCIEDLQNIYGP